MENEDKINPYEIPVLETLKDIDSIYSLYLEKQEIKKDKR
jgi:hypothetical protein